MLRVTDPRDKLLLLLLLLPLAAGVLTEVREGGGLSPESCAASSSPGASGKRPAGWGGLQRQYRAESQEELCYDCIGWKRGMA